MPPPANGCAVDICITVLLAAPAMMFRRRMHRFDAQSTAWHRHAVPTPADLSCPGNESRRRAGIARKRPVVGVMIMVGFGKGGGVLAIQQVGVQARAGPSVTFLACKAYGAAVRGWRGVRVESLPTQSTVISSQRASPLNASEPKSNCTVNSPFCHRHIFFGDTSPIYCQCRHHPTG